MLQKHETQVQVQYGCLIESELSILRLLKIVHIENNFKQSIRILKEHNNL